MTPETSPRGSRAMTWRWCLPLRHGRRDGAGQLNPSSSSPEMLMAAKIEEALSKLQRLRARISQLLGSAGPRHIIVRSDAGRRCLAFMEMELSILAAFLTSLSQQHLDVEMYYYWLQTCCTVLRFAEYVLGSEVDASRRTLLRKATQCFLLMKSYLLLNEMAQLYYMSEHPCRYMNLLPTGSDDLGLIKPQPGEAGALLPLVGIDRPANKIFRWLTHQGKMDRSQLRVMSVVGPVGIGKTTLAVEVRNRLIRHQTSSGGRHYFHCNFMVQASRGADRNILLLRDVLSQVSNPARPALPSRQSHFGMPHFRIMELLRRRISERLQHKRYFIIINDLSEESDWEEIKGAFPNNNLGSRILITTRVTSVAEACCSGSYDGLVHKMKPLNKIDSERLLLSKAVGYGDGFLPDNMKLFCDETLRRCDGIPLFIIGMADWLIKEQLQQQQQQRVDEDDEHQRLAVCREGQMPQLLERLEQSLSSAFNYFPNNESRLLLLYMSMLPYGYKFDKDRLLWKWMHEGLSQYAPYRFLGLSHFIYGEERFFSQLVDMNVINCVAWNYEHKQDEAEDCQWQVNHCMQQFLATKSAEIGFFFTTATLNLVAPAAAHRSNETSSRMPRRLALHHPIPQLQSLLVTLDLSQTRSLSVSGTVSGIPLDKFANLVLLDLEGWENLKDEDLLQVCRSKMFFLTYLSVRNTRVSKLPPDIKELRILGTLDVSYTQITELPLELFELKYLERLDLRGTRISQVPKQIGGLKERLANLLIGGEGTINSTETTILPQDVRHLYKLDTLATVDLTEHPASFVRSLGDLSRLRVLAVIWSFHQSSDKDSREALVSSIKKWEELESLTIHCVLGCSMEFLGSLEEFDAPMWLEKFKVTVGRFASVPPWIHRLERLAFMQITVCNKQTAANDLQILGYLPTLQCLILGLDFIPGQPIVIGNEGFPELRRFSLDCPMPWLTFSTGAMPKLTYLQLNFSSTPASEMCVPSGISNVRRLTEVALSYNAQYLNSPSIKMTVDAVTKQVAEHCNPIDLFINGIQQDDVQEYDDEVTETTIGTSSRTNAVAEDDDQAVGEEATAATQCEITEADS